MSDAGGRPTEPGGPRETGSGLRAGATFAGLEVEGEVGRGGMGVIYRARDPELDRVRALKVLAAERSADDEFRERFRRESRQAAAIEHPNVIPVYRAGEEDGRLFLVMRFVDGPSLAEVLADRGRLRVDETVDLVHKVAGGLDAAHAAGLVHRDVKPANILLEDGRAFLGDFGISKLAAAGDALTSTGQFVGTVDYVAPEQLEGEAVDRRADVYSLACVAFHALTGEAPFARDTQLATMFAHANAPRPEAGPSVPSKIRETLTRGMAISPDDRPASAGEFAADLERAAGASSVATTERLTAPTRDRLNARRLFLVAGLAGLAAVVAAVVLIATLDDDGPPAPAVATEAHTVPEGPLGITVGPGRVWVASPPAERVTSLRLDDPVQTEEFPAGSAPAAVAVGFDSLWVVDRRRDELVRIDPATGAEQATVGVGEEPSDVAVGSEEVWVGNAGSNEVSRVDPSDGGAEIADTIPVGDHPSALAVAPDGVWVANRDDGTVLFIDAERSGLSGRPIDDAGARPNDVVLGDGVLWVADNVNSTVSSFDPQSREMEGEPIAVGALPRSLAFGLGYVWVANGEDGTVDRIDPEAGEVAGDPIPVGAQPASIAVGPDSVWTADFGDSTVTELHPDG
jgi:streptogramin lyase/predicted Ser/Thr protein kinase